MLVPCIIPVCGHRAVMESVRVYRSKEEATKTTVANYELGSKVSAAEKSSPKKPRSVTKVVRETDREQWTGKQGPYDVRRSLRKKTLNICSTLRT